MENFRDNECLDSKSDMDKEETKDLMAPDKEKLLTVNRLFCDPCLIENCEKEAVGFCRNCAEYLCEGCIRDHRKLKLTRGHTVLEDNLPKEPEIFIKMKELINCKDHPNSRLTSKCIEHDIVICSLCVAETHRKCTLHEFTRSDIENNKIDSAFMCLDELTNNCEAAKRKLESKKKSILEEQETVDTKLKKFVQAVSANVTTLGEQKSNELHGLATGRLSDVASDLEKCNGITEAVTMHLKILKAAISYCDDGDVHLLEEVMSARSATFVKDIKRIEENENHNEMQFRGNGSLLSLSSIGEIELGKCGNGAASFVAQSSDEFQEVKFVSQSAQTDLQDVSSPSQKPVTSSMDRRFEKNATVYTVKLMDDKFLCRINGMVVLPDDRIVIIDYNNSAIKLFTNEFSFKAVFYLNDNPIDICLVKQNTIVISSFNLKKIDRFGIEDSYISYEGRFYTKLFNLSVTRYTDHLAILMSDQKLGVETDSTSDIVEIQFRDPESGQCFRTVNIFESNSTYRSFDLWCPLRVRFNGDTEFLIVEPNRVSCFECDDDCDEAVLDWYYKSKGNSVEYGMTAAEFDTDSVFFCSLKGAIGQISAKDYGNKNLIEENIVSPACICLDSERKRILVGCYKDNYVHAYHCE